MAHEVEDGPVSVVKIVNPCLYWVRCPTCLSILDVHKILESSSLTKATQLERGDRLVVRSLDGRLYRAVLQGPATIKWAKKGMPYYKMFFIDTLEIFVVGLEQIFQVNHRTIMNDLVQQLHLVGIEYGKAVGNLESGVYNMDEDAHLEAQRREIFRELKQVEGVEFEVKRKCENVLLGKMKLMKSEDKKYLNLLRFLIDRRLAQYNENLMSVVMMSEWMDKVLEERKAVQDLLFPPPLIVEPKEVLSRKLPPPPPVVFDQEQFLHLKNITKDLGSTNILDRIVPNPKVESFAEMNQRYRMLSRYESVLRKNAPISKEQKFEYTSDSSSLAGGFVDVEVKNNEDRWIHPPTSSEDSLSSVHPASSVDLLTNDSDLNDTISSSDSELPTTENNPKFVSEAWEQKRPKNYIRASEVETSPTNQLGNEERVSFGRGMMFQKYLSSPRHHKSASVDADEVHTAGQFDDANPGITPKDTSCVCNVFPGDDSFIDFIDGFLDESGDSEVCYGDVVRMNKNENFVPSPVEARPVRPSSTASLPQPLPIPEGDIQAGDLSAEESVSSLSSSRSSSVSSRSVNLPNLLPINKRRGKSEQKPNPKSGGDFAHSSPNNKSSLAEKFSDCVGRVNSHGGGTNISLKPTTNCNGQFTKEITNGSDFPRPTLSIIGRGKFLEERFNLHKVPQVSSPGESIKAPDSADDAALKEIMTDESIISAKVGLQSSSPVKGFGRGTIFKKPVLLQKLLGSTTLPSQRSIGMTNKLTDDGPVVAVKSTMQRNEVEKAKPNSNQSSVKVTSLSVSTRQDKLEEALKKMSIQANSDDVDDGSSGTESGDLPQPQTKPLLTEFVDESEKQEPTSASDDEKESNTSHLPHNLGHLFLDREDRALKISSGILHGATGILPAKYLSNLHINDHILTNARYHKVDFLTRPQYYGIPAVLKMKNVVFVGPNKSKKSSAFVIPLLSLLMDETYYSPLRRGNGPRCVFVAPTSDRVKTLGRLCSTFCGARLITITTYGGGLELERKNELTSGCDILITTPRCWLRLLKYPVVTNLSRLCHLVLDRFDVLSDLFSPELKTISLKMVELTNIRAKSEALSSLSVQTILSSEQWSPAVEQVVTKLLNKPVVVITSYLEAMLYARIRPKVTLVESGARLSKLMDLVDAHSSEKVVVVCVTPEEVTEVRKACSAKYISIVAHENMARSLITEVNPQWNNSKLPPLLICSDAVIYDLGITDAQVLIHFTLPDTKTKFGERFVVLRDHLPDRLLNPKVAPPNCVVHIMFDEACEAPFPCIVDFLRRVSVKIPDNAYEVVKDIERKKEEGKTTAPFCENILQMGSCYKVSSCRSRHVALAAQDTPKNHLMSYGLIKVQIIHVHSAVKYSARILAHNPNVNGSGGWTKCKSEFTTLTLELGSFYASPANRRQHGRPKEGDLVAYQEHLDHPFSRARVLNIVKRNKHQEPTEVRIFLVDEGIEKHCETHSLIELPDHLKKYPDQAVYIYLANLKPVDLDTTWSYAAKKLMDKEIHRSEIDDKADQDVVGKILFTIGRNCVVENLRWCQHTRYNQCFFTRDLRQLLLNSGCGIDNPEYSSNLFDICSSANMMCGLYHSSEEKTLTSDEKMASETEHKEPPRWAHLPRDEGFVKVNTVVDESPSLFYVKMPSVHRQLEELESDLTTHMNNYKEIMKNPQVGDVCAVECPQDSEGEPKWNRGLIYEISGEEASIFFVDYGDRKTMGLANLYSIPWKYVIKLPFQAIECKLAGVFPSDDEKHWSEAANIEFHNMVSKNYYWGEFYVKVVDLDFKGTRTGGKCYHVILLDVDGDSPVVINHVLVKKGYGYQFSLEVDETELIEVYKHVKECESRADADDEDEDVEHAGESKLLDFNFDEADKEEMLDLIRMIDPEGAAYIDRAMPPKPPLKAITAGSAQADDTQGEVAPSENFQSDDNQLTRCHKEPPDLEECGKHVSPPFTSLLDSSDEPLLVRCAPLKTPLIYWRQDTSTITIKYMIPCLQKYKLDVSPFSVSFRAIVENESGNDEYWNRINFFGPVLETSMSEALSVTCLRLKVFKRIQGYLWPRLLHNDSKNHRIKVDPEDDTLHPEEWLDDGTQRIGASVEPGPLLESSDDDDEEDGDELFFEHEDDEADPFNPLT